MLVVINNKSRKNGRSRRLEEKLDEVLKSLKTLTMQGERIMQELDDLKTKVAENTTVIGSAKVLLGGLKTALDSAIAALPNRAELTALSAQLGTDRDELAAVVAANTPAAP